MLFFDIACIKFHLLFCTVEQINNCSLGSNKPGAPACPPLPLNLANGSLKLSLWLTQLLSVSPLVRSSISSIVIISLKLSSAAFQQSTFSWVAYITTEIIQTTIITNQYYLSDSTQLQLLISYIHLFWESVVLLFLLKQSIILFNRGRTMFKRLFASQNQIEKVFEQCKIDRSHDMPHTKAVADLAARYFLPDQDRQNIHININIQNTNSNNININITNPKNKSKMTKKQEFISHYLKRLKHENIIQRIKTLVAGHAIIKKTMDSDFAEYFEAEIQKYIVPELNMQRQNTEPNIEIKVESGKQDYLQTNIISFYCFYLKKMIINFETFLFAKKYPALSSEEKKKQNIIEIINHGFIVLNLVNYILRSQYTFNKMGRYYLEHKEFLGVFIKYLQDLLIYNTFIKSVTTLSLKNIKEAGSEETRHHFLFVTQAQKTSDRLYEFFYNRYYYNQVKTLILMPTFLNIHNQEYKELVSHVKRRDRELVLLVKKSKYEQPRSQSCHLRSITQASESQALNMSQRTQEKDLNKTNLSFVDFGDTQQRREKRAMSEYKRKD